MSRQSARVVRQRGSASGGRRSRARATVFASAAVLVALAGTARPVAAPSAPPDDSLADVRTYFERLEKLGFAGAVLIAREGRPLLTEGYGLADRERGIVWTPATVSTIGSITKQFTGALILKLAEEGLLSPDDALGAHFEGVPADKAAITLHQLLTHSSGIVDLAGVGDWDPVGREEYVRRILAQPLEFPPGEDYAYSNAGYSLLGAIVERLTGVSYERALRERLLLPAGLYETGYVLARWGEDRVAVGYRAGERWGTVLERPLDEDGPFWALRANGGLHSNAYDMLRWAEALRGGRALSRESMERYWAPHVDEGGGTHYGYGWVVVDSPAGRVITHNGGNGILFADMAIVPSAGIVAFLQTNVAAELPLVEGVLGRLGERLLAGRPMPELPDRVDRSAAELEALAGRYRLADGELAVTVEGSKLRLAAADPAAFGRLHSTRPFDAARAARLTARLDEVIGATLAGDFGPRFEAYRRQVPIERLRQGWDLRQARFEERYGPSTGYEILGTAFLDEQDVTLVRLLFENGHVDDLYDWDAEREEHLLGIWGRGLDPVLRVVPEASGAFATWDPRGAASRPVRFETDESGSVRLLVGVGAAQLAATKRSGDRR